MRVLVSLALVLCAQVAFAAPAPANPRLPGAPAKFAATAVDGLRSRLGLGPADALTLASHKPAAGGGSIARYQQFHAGVPVVDAVVTVRFDAEGRVLRTFSSAVIIESLAISARLTREEAIRSARGFVRVPLPVEVRGAARLVFARAGQLAWEVYVPTALPIHSLLVTVDAQDGRLLELRDRARHAGTGKVFPSSKAARDARQADGTFNTGALVSAAIPNLLSTAEGAHLASEALIGFNCCAHENCDPSKGPHRLAISVPIDNPQTPDPTDTINIQGSIAMCHEIPLAAANAAGDFDYVPGTEPTTPTAPMPGPSEDDAFAEVMTFHYASAALTYIRTLDPQFQLRVQAQPLHVTANFLLPDIEEAINNFDFISFSTSTTNLKRTDNAAYVPAGVAGELGIPAPELERDFDSIILFQGERSDFAYDADVIVHEFGHGVVAATAHLTDFVADSQGIIDAPGAINEGLADYFAAARENDPKIGEYVGDLSGKGEGTLRNLDNQLACPSLLWGEVHQDSKHFSAALWATRSAIATDDATRLSFDRAVLASLSLMSPLATFEEAIAAIGGELEAGLGVAARTKLAQEAATRGVTGCERVVDLVEGTPRGPVLIAPAAAARGWKNYAPGPLQFRIRPPAGATAMRVVATGKATGGLGDIQLPFGNGSAINLRGTLKADAAIAFAYAANGVSNDGTEPVDFVAGNPDPDAAWTIDGACGEKTLFVALLNTSPDNQWIASQVAVSFTVDPAKASACAPDAGPAVDAGTYAGSGDDASAGCGCAGTSPFAWAALGALALRRRRR